MRLVLLLTVLAFAPAAQAQRCHASSATTALEGFAAGLQLSLASTQISISLAQLAQRASACQHDADCSGRYRCEARQCVAPDDGSNQKDERAELFLRSRAVELREELTLGKGPVIDGLAAARGQAAGELGKAMKANRAELRALMGDGSDPAWARRFLVALGDGA